MSLLLKPVGATIVSAATVWPIASATSSRENNVIIGYHGAHLDPNQLSINISAGGVALLTVRTRQT